MCNNRVEFLSHFDREMENGVLIRCEFSKDTTWYKWSAPNGTKNIR